MASCSNQKILFLLIRIIWFLIPSTSAIFTVPVLTVFFPVFISAVSLYIFTPPAKKISHKTPLLIHDSETSIPIIHSTLRRKMTMRDLTTLTIIFSRPFIGGAMSFDSNFSLLFSCFEYGKC